jgi:glycylpeptide N-tetradecanoyltransferase
VDEVYTLLTQNYVEDDDAMFRFDYSKPFLAWALRSPGFHADWHVGVRAKPTGKLVAFITGIPAHVRVRTTELPMAEINFLCIHKKLRSKRLAPLLIKEVTRRINARGTWQAAYTAGVVLPKPVAVARYWHRTLNAKKLIDVGFTRLPAKMTLMRTIKYYKMEPKELSAGVRSMRPDDAPAVTRLLAAYLARYDYAPVLDESEVLHWLLPREGVVYSYVVESETGTVTDFFSFYNLPSTVINHPVHSSLRAAYCYYYVPGSLSASVLLKDALTMAAGEGFDVFNALDVMENSPELMRELRFGIGDGHLQYYGACLKRRACSAGPPATHAGRTQSTTGGSTRRCSRARWGSCCFDWPY